MVEWEQKGILALPTHNIIILKGGFEDAGTRSRNSVE
jgi:hypothetical protein